jgi:hypothetical protein
MLSWRDDQIVRNREILEIKSSSLTDVFRGRKVVKCELSHGTDLLIVLDTGDTVRIHSYKYDLKFDLGHE